MVSCEVGICFIAVVFISINEKVLRWTGGGHVINGKKKLNFLNMK